MSSFNSLNGYDVEDNRVNGLISNNKYHFIKTTSISGDCILLELENANIISDLSRSTNITPITNYFFTHNINKLDGIIISHYHGDHCGGANAEGFVALVASNYVTSDTVVYLPKDPDYTLFTDDETNVVSRLQTIRQNILNACETKGLTVRHMETNDEVTFGNTILRFLNSDETSFSDYYDILVDSNNNLTTHTNYNNFSMVTEVQNLNNTFLLTADIEYGAETNVEKYLRRPISIKKIEHHGVNHLSNTNYLLKSNAYFNLVMNTTEFNYNGGRYESFAYIIKNGGLIYTSETNSNMIFEDNGYEIKAGGNYIKETLLLQNGVAGMIAGGTTNFKNLGEVSYRNIIATGDDLDDYMTCGDYLCNSGTVASSLSNCPISTDAFKLTVEYNLNKDRLYQRIFRNNKNIEIYYRYYDANGWNDWNLFTDSRHAQAQLTTSTTLSGSNDYIKIPLNNLTHGIKFELSDDGGLHALTSMVVLTGGYVTVSGVNANDVLNLAVYKNNVRIARFGVRTSATEITLQVPQIMTSVTSEDTLYLYIRNQSSSTATVSVNNAFNVISV